MLAAVGGHAEPDVAPDLARHAVAALPENPNQVIA